MISTGVTKGFHVDVIRTMLLCIPQLGRHYNDILTTRDAKKSLQKPNPSLDRHRTKSAEPSIETSQHL